MVIAALVVLGSVATLLAVASVGLVVASYVVDALQARAMRHQDGIEHQASIATLTIADAAATRDVRSPHIPTAIALA
jgi:hypothetical protein